MYSERLRSWLFWLQPSSCGWQSYSSLAGLPWPHLMVMQHKTERDSGGKRVPLFIAESLSNLIFIILFVLCNQFYELVAM